MADEPGMVQADWLGAPMFFSHFDDRTSQAMIEAAGFKIWSANVVVDPVDTGPEPFAWIAASAPADDDLPLDPGQR